VKTAVVIMSLIALLYTFMGGTVAVIWTDVFQASVLFIGAFVIVFSLWHRLPMPLPDFLHQLSLAGKTRALNFSTEPSVEATVWSGVIAMSLYHVTIYGANQMMVQRTLAAKNIGDAKKSYLLMGFVAFFIYFLFFLLGILFYGYYGGREFSNGNTIILEFAAEQHIPGLMGVIVASIIAASMSSLGAAINSLSTVSTVDSGCFYNMFYGVFQLNCIRSVWMQNSVNNGHGAPNRCNFYGCRGGSAIGPGTATAPAPGSAACPPRARGPRAR
jgi:SSS family solute:Na+ symporter